MELHTWTLTLSGRRVPFYEVFARQFRKDGDSFMKHVNDRTLLCDNFYNHETVLAHGPEACFPVRLFVDYAKLDNQVSTLNSLQPVCSNRRWG